MFSENYFSINFIGDDSKVDTPVPIPNTEVKHFNGEDSLRENSKLPIFFAFKTLEIVRNQGFLFYYLIKRSSTFIFPLSNCSSSGRVV